MAVSKSTQDFVDVKEIKDGILVLKDGSLRSILMCSSINFALKSEENQVAIISQFQNFLNAIDFSIQILVQSRKLNINPYLSLLEERYKKQSTDLMKIQVREYVDFVKDFTSNVNIMTKNFFVVVPFGSAKVNIQRDVTKSLSNLLPGRSKEEKVSKEQALEQSFEEKKMQLQQRLAVVEQSLARVGIRTAKLGSDELVELFYKIFNPGEQEKPTIPKG